MAKPILIAAFLLAAAPAQAAPIDLQCSVSDGGKATSIDITLDEANKSATWQWKDDPNPLSGPAVFTATKVVMRTITIDRVTLAFTQSYDLGDGPVSKRGTCKRVKVTRAF